MKCSRFIKCGCFCHFTGGAFGASSEGGFCLFGITAATAMRVILREWE